MALAVNLVFLLIAFVFPSSMVNGASSNSANAGMQAALLFAAPMGIIAVIGLAVVIWAYIWSRREGCPMPVVAFLPLCVFLVGLAIALALTFRTSTTPGPVI